MGGWVELLTSEADRAYLVALRATGDCSLAEDAVQEAGVRLLAAPVPEMGPAQLRAYVLKTVQNAALNLAGSSAARGRREEAVQMQKATTTPGPDEAMAAAELAGAAREALAGLPAELRMAVSLCCEQGLSHREAGEVLGVPKDTVTDRVRRGLARLQQVLTASGFASCAPAALAAGLGSLGVPAAPAGLVAKIQGMAGGAQVAGVGAGTVAAGAAKGGLTVKILAGVVLAGALAGGLSAFGFRRSEPLATAPLASPPAGAAEQKGERVYDLVPLGRSGFMNHQSMFLWTGPAGSSRVSSLYGMQTDNDGNVYAVTKAMVGRGGSEGGVTHECVVMKWDRKTDMFTRLAGGARGAALDGPGEMAQLNYQWYSGGGSAIDRRRGYFFFTDNVNGLIRRVDIKNGYVTTIGREVAQANAVAADQDGVVYIHATYGKAAGLYRLTPEGEPGKETYKSERIGLPIGVGGLTLLADAKRGKVYSLGRGSDIATVQVWDLKAGSGGPVKPAPIATPNGSKADYFQSDGPLEGARFWCPHGSGISPDGRHLYLGGGDENTIRRIDVDGKRVSSLVSLPDGRFTWIERREKKNGLPYGGHYMSEALDGSLYFECEGVVYRLRPEGER